MKQIRCIAFVVSYFSFLSYNSIKSSNVCVGGEKVCLGFFFDHDRQIIIKKERENSERTVHLTEYYLLIQAATPVILFIRKSKLCIYLGIKKWTDEQ